MSDFLITILFFVALHVILVYNAVIRWIWRDNMTFMRERLKQRRKEAGLTLQAVADEIGVEKPTVQRYESDMVYVHSPQGR